MAKITFGLAPIDYSRRNGLDATMSLLSAAALATMEDCEKAGIERKCFELFRFNLNAHHYGDFFDGTLIMSPCVLKTREEQKDPSKLEIDLQIAIKITDRQKIGDLISIFHERITKNLGTHYADVKRIAERELKSLK